MKNVKQRIVDIFDRLKGVEKKMRRFRELSEKNKNLEILENERQSGN